LLAAHKDRSAAEHPEALPGSLQTAMTLTLLHVLGSSTPCRASEKGCGGGNVVGVILLVFLAAGAILGVLSWIWFRWERGPFMTIMRVLANIRGPR
jgi:hypothetical protein